MATTIVPKAREIMPRSAIVNGASPLTIRVAGTDPTPMNTRNAVPMTSAASRWSSDGLVEHGLVPSVPSMSLRTTFDIVECDADSYTCDSLMRKSFRRNFPCQLPARAERGGIDS